MASGRQMVPDHSTPARPAGMSESVITSAPLFIPLRTNSRTPHGPLTLSAQRCSADVMWYVLEYEFLFFLFAGSVSSIYSVMVALDPLKPEMPEIAWDARDPFLDDEIRTSDGAWLSGYALLHGLIVRGDVPAGAGSPCTCERSPLRCPTTPVRER